VKPAATTNASEIDQVSSPPNGASVTNAINTPSTAGETDSELQRADELVSLHYDVKLKYLETGSDAELEKAAEDVEKVLRDIRRSKSRA
jgi:heptaprenylglyceryl phosphate synthase